MFDQFDFHALRRNPQVAFYFRYALHLADFHEVREQGRLIGRYAAKPLYGKQTTTGKLDRAAGFDGRIAVIFIPARARTARAAVVLITRVAAQQVTLANGRRNWPAIRAAAEQAVRRKYTARHKRIPSSAVLRQ